MIVSLVILFPALVADRLIGDPDWMWKRIPHPVSLFGKAISTLERRFNRPTSSPSHRRATGVATICVLLLGSLISGFVLHRFFMLFGFAGFVLEAALVGVLLAQKSLADHVSAVSQGLMQDGLDGGRKAVSMIVGRDPQTLDRSGVCRAAIESLAENFSDGVVAPALWYAVLGLPGILAYKMLNTADSMIGHKSERYLHFGWAAARLDDLANWPAARLSMLLIAAGAAFANGRSSAFRAIAIGWRDHGLHRSPNAGWPEAAMAGALDIQLAGPRFYSGMLVDDDTLNPAGKDRITESDISAALRVFHMSCSVLTALVAVVAFSILNHG